MATRRSEWLASIKPILDRDEAKRDAVALAKELGDILDVKVDASPENLDELAKEFNAQLKTMGKQPIVFSEKTLRGIVSQFTNAIAQGISAGVSKVDFSAQLEELSKKREKVLKAQNRANQAMKARSRMERLENFNINTAELLPIDGDVTKEAQQIVDTLYDSASKIDKAAEKYGKSSSHYTSAVIDAQEAYNKYLRMQKTLGKMSPSQLSAIPKDVKALYDKLGPDRDRYESGGGMNIPFEETFEAEKILDSFEELSDAFESVVDDSAKFDKMLKQIDAKIEEITRKARESGGVDDGILSGAKDGLKTLNEIEAAYKRLKVDRGTKLRQQNESHIKSALDFDPDKNSVGIKTFAKDYYDAAASGDWVEEYHALLRYVKLYESYLNSTNKTHQNKVTAKNNPFTPLYEQLKPMAENARNMLQNIINLGEGVPLVGMGGAEKDKEKAISTEADNAERIADAKKISAAEGEKSADANKRAADEAERENLAKEASADVDKTNYDTDTSIINPSKGSDKTDRENIQTILNDANKFLSSNTDKKIEDYFELISTRAIEMSDDVKSAIEATIGNIDSLQSINIGSNNRGGLIGDKSALILKKPHWDEDNKRWSVDQQQSDDAIELQNRLSGINMSDVDLGKIREVINTEEYLVELQNRVGGAPMSTIGEAIEGINPDILNATEISIRSLISAMRELYNIGIETDVENLGNILYDGQNDHFGIVDMDVKHDFESFEDMLNAFAQTVRYRVEDIANVLNDPKMAEAWSRFADMVDAEIGKVVPSAPVVNDDVEIIAKENGELEDKLELLQEIAEQYGNNISQKQRDRYEELNQKDMNEGLTTKEDERYWELGEQIEEADQALEEFGQTYDKIIVKLANGKNVEILPDDKGLRTLAKIDEEYGESYNGVEIEDVIFERAKQEVASTEQAVDGLNESLEKTQQLTSGDGTGFGTGNASFSDLEAERAKAESLQNEIEQKNSQLAEKDSAIQAANNDKQTLQNDLDVANRQNAELRERASNDGDAIFTAEQRANEAEEKAAMYDRAMTSMQEEMADLRGKLAGAKTGGGEGSSASLEELKNVLSAIVYNVKIAHDDNDKTANKIALDDSTLEATLTKVFANILKPEAPQGTAEPSQEHWALESTLQNVKGVLDNIQTNTAKIGTSNQPKVDMIAGTALDSRLIEIKSVLESINGQIVNGGVITTRGAVKQAASQPVESEAKAQSARSNIMKSLINDYKTLGKLSAKFASDGDLQTKAMLENLKAEITRKRQSLKVTMDESKILREKYSIAFDAEKRLLDAAKAQKEVDKQNRENDRDEKAVWKKRVKDAQRETGINAADSVYRATNNTVIRAIGTEGISADIEAKAKELAEQNKILNNLRNSINEKGAKASEEERDNLSQQISKVKELKTEVDGYLKIHEKYSGGGATQFDDVDTSNFGAVGTDQYWNNITAAIKNATGARVNIKGMNTDTGELTGTTKIAANTFAEWSATVDPITGKLSMLRTGIKKTETVIEQIKRKTKEIFTYFSGSSMIFKVVNELKKGIQYVREIDLALTELKKVTDETEETYDKFLETAAKTADKVGSTIQKVVSSTADWARLGYSMKEAAEFAESTQILMNVSEFTDVSQATDTLISAVQAFGYTAETSMDVVDLLNTIGKQNCRNYIVIYG